MRNIGLLLLLIPGFYSCSPVLVPEVSNAVITTVDSVNVSEVDSSAMRIISPYRDSMQKSMNEILAFSEQSMSRGLPESLLGNFVADIVLDRASVALQGNGNPVPDFCLLNNGGLRSSLPAGSILLRHAYELMPFDNEIVILELSGSDTEKLFQFICEKKGAPVSGVRIVIDSTGCADVMIRNTPFNKNRNYKVATSDYLAGGGDGADFFKGALSEVKTGIKVRDAIIDYLRSETAQGRNIKYSTDGRITNR